MSLLAAMDGRRHLFWLAAPLLVVCVAAILLVYALYIEATARSILRDVSALRVGQSSTADIKATAESHRNVLSEYRCDAQKCFASFEVYNTWLHRLRLEPIARFRAVVESDDGEVDFIRIVLERDTRAFPTSPSAGITEEYLTAPGIYADRGPYWFPTPVGKPYLRVALTTGATPQQRQHAYDYSLTCLTKPGGGCDLPCDYLPVAWHDWEAQLEQRGFGFGSYYPARNRCR